MRLNGFLARPAVATPAAWRATRFRRSVACTIALLSAALIGVVPVRGAPPPAPATIVFFGDSLTAGYGLDEPATESFPARIEQKIAAAGLPYRVVNAGLSGETTAGGLRRIDWVLRQPISVLVLELGANDGLRGIDPRVTRDNLQAIIDKVRARNGATTVVLAGMMMPPSMGDDYTRDYGEIFRAVAEKNHTAFVPFLLEGVGGRPELNQPDGIHPTAQGHAIVANTLWKILQPLLQQPAGVKSPAAP